MQLRQRRLSRAPASRACGIGLVLGVAWACGGSADSRGQRTSVGERDDVEPPPASQWQLPEGGVAVDVVPESDLSAVDAFGNLWLQGCGGLFVVHPEGIQRYRYLDTPWSGGQAQVTADARGRVWVQSDVLRQVYTGKVQQVAVPPPAPVAELVFASDGVAWALKYDESRMESGWFSLQSFYPGLGPDLPAPRWASNALPGRAGALWLRADEEVYRFGDGRFWGPYVLPSSAPPYYYDPQDDTLGLTGNGVLTKLAFDGQAIAVREQRNIAWLDAIGRLSDGRLAVRSRELEVLVLDSDESAGEVIAASGTRGVLSPFRELYLQSPSGISRYREGRVERLLSFGEPPPELPAWQEQGYARALRASSEDAVADDFEPPIPALLHHKLHIVGRGYVPGFESPAVIDVDGRVSVPVRLAPELRVFAESQGLEIIQPERALLGPPAAPTGELWDLYGYLESDECYSQPGKVFHLIEAYPVGMAAAQREALATGLRRANPE
jgi:hypothetical protein